MNSSIFMRARLLVILGPFLLACGIVRHTDEEPSHASLTQASTETTALSTSAGLNSPTTTITAIEVPPSATPSCFHRRSDGNCIAPSANDADGDGFPADKDCDDHDPFTYPGAPEAKCDGVDEDCNGEDLCPIDRDHDGFSAPGDCDDKDAHRNPGAREIFCNGIDEDCNGYDDCDADKDGDSAPMDCNDHDPTISAHAKEVFCDGIDQDCNGTDCCSNDADGDGAPCSADCDDTDPHTYPGAPVPAGCFWKDVNCDGTMDGVCR